MSAKNKADEDSIETRKASIWLKPDQVEQIRNAAFEIGAEYLQTRNEAIVAFIYDTGVRVGELVQLREEHVDLDESTFYFPSHLRKDPPIDGVRSPPLSLELDRDDGIGIGTIRSLKSYLSGSWRDDRETGLIFPSRQSDRMTTEQVRNVVRKLSIEAGIEPHTEDGGRGDPDDVTPHVFRHSVGYRMLALEDARLIDVRNRLGHSSISTTESVYDHFRLG